jgi:hypothetical protein
LSSVANTTARAVSAETWLLWIVGLSVAALAYAIGYMRGYKCGAEDWGEKKEDGP